MPKSVARPPPLDWARVIAGVIVLAFVSFFIGTFLDGWYGTQGSPWTIILGFTGTVSPLGVGIYLRIRHPDSFHRMLRFFEALGTKNDEDADEVNSTASSGGRASSAVARDHANQVVVQGDYFAGGVSPLVNIRERRQIPAGDEEKDEVRSKRRGSPSNGKSVVNKTLVLRSGEYESWPVEATAGDRLRGTIESDGTLNVLLLDEDDYATYVEDDDYETENALGEDRKFIPVNVELQSDGVWYLVVEVYGKQNPRTVTLRVRHLAQATAQS